MRQTTAMTALALLLAYSPAHSGNSFDGSLELEQRIFFDRDTDIDTVNRGQTSLRLQAEYFWDWNDGNDQIVFEPLARIDSDDTERSHADFRQLNFTHESTNYEYSIGLGQVFWGVTESKHLVDIINQTDGVENVDGEDKLGQPMLRYRYFADWGTLDAFVLPYFRKRTFAGPDGRLNGGLNIDPDRAAFESAAQESHVDVAARYSNTFGPWGVGVSWFSGTSREPDLLRLFDPTQGSTVAYYPQIDQFGADIQLTTDAWLFKLEAIQRNFDDDYYADFAAATFGGEYTLVGLFGSIYDLGLLAEYSWDERQDAADTLLQDDLFVGARLALNDISDSQILFGAAHDFDITDSRAYFIEAATRIAPALTINVELRYFDSNTQTDPLFRFKDDSFIQLGLEYFFD